MKLLITSSSKTHSKQVSIALRNERANARRRAGRYLSAPTNLHSPPHLQPNQPGQHRPPRAILGEKLSAHIVGTR